MSELRLIKKTTCDFIYSDKAVQLSKYALYLSEERICWAIPVYKSP